MIAALSTFLLRSRFGRSAMGLRPCCAAFVMQMGVQGAWGVIPVHTKRNVGGCRTRLMPGLAYQLGILSRRTNSASIPSTRSCWISWAIAGFEIVTIVTLAVLLLCGTEAA